MKNTKSYEHKELLDALYYMHDLFDRALVPFFLIGITAKCAVKNEELSGDALHLGVRKLDLTQSGMNVLSILTNAEEVTEKRIIYKTGGVPVHVHIYQKENRMITNPEYVMYMYESFRVPNQFDKYWKVKHLLK